MVGASSCCKANVDRRQHLQSLSGANHNAVLALQVCQILVRQPASAQYPYGGQHAWRSNQARLAWHAYTAVIMLLQLHVLKPATVLFSL